MSHPQPLERDLPSLSAQTIACLEFFERWETPVDKEAAEVYTRLRHDAPDYATFQRLAPAGSKERSLFERFLSSFEDAGQRIRAGQMRADLFFDSWYGMPAAWQRAQPYVLGLRAETGNPRLYEHFEWLAPQAERFWAEQEHTPRQERPITTPEPTPNDQAIFAIFHRHMFPAPDAPEWALFAELKQHAPTFEAFFARVQPHTPDFITFDWLLCAYDRAGALTRYGIIHPALLFHAWRSPKEVWQTAAPWVTGLQRELNSPHLYEHVEWLAAFEDEWRAS